MTATLKDIADRAGVTKMTVSLVLNSHQYHRVSPRTRERVESIAREMNYRPNVVARQLRGERSGILGLLIPEPMKDYAFERFSAIESESHAHGYRLLVGQVAPGDDRLEGYLGDFAGRGIEGLIWMGHQQFPPAMVQSVVERVSQVVLIGQPAPTDAHSVALDFERATERVVDHLVAVGRRRIAITLDNEAWIGTRQRQQGYRRAIRRHGLAEDPQLARVRPGGDAEELSCLETQIADELVQQLVLEARADAIYANNDRWAAVLIKALRRRGVGVPDDVAIVAQNNSELSAYFDPPISSLDLQPTALARRAVEVLAGLARGERLPPQQRVSWIELELVPRASTLGRAAAADAAEPGSPPHGTK